MTTKPPVSAPRRRVAPGFSGEYEVDDVVSSEMAFGGAPYRSDRAMDPGPKSFSAVETFQSQKDRMEQAARDRMNRQRFGGGLAARDEAPLANAAKAEMAPDSYYGDMTISGRLASPDSSTRALMIGSQGPRVTQAQRLLQSLNYGVPNSAGKLAELAADGDYGKNTKNAVMAFQKDVGLKPDGIIGDDTIGKMLEKFNESVQKLYRDQHPATEQPRILSPMEEPDKVFKRPVVMAGEEIDETIQKT